MWTRTRTSRYTHKHAPTHPPLKTGWMNPCSQILFNAFTWNKRRWLRYVCGILSGSVLKQLLFIKTFLVNMILYYYPEINYFTRKWLHYKWIHFLMIFKITLFTAPKLCYILWMWIRRGAKRLQKFEIFSIRNDLISLIFDWHFAHRNAQPRLIN